MALPAMIQKAAENQTSRYAALSQSLANLGQQVGATLAQREYQRQAAEALPAMQESYRRAFGKIQQGFISEGYMDVLNTSMQFGSTQNPFLMGYIEQANKFAKEAGDARLSQAWQNIQMGRSAGSDTGDGKYVPSSEELLSGTYKQPTATTDTSIPAMRGMGGGGMGSNTRDSIDQQAADNLPQPDLGMPISEVPPTAGQGFSFGAGSIEGPSKFQPPTQIINKAGQAIAAYASQTPEEKKAWKDSNTISDYSGKTIPFDGILGYENVSGTEPTRQFGETGRTAKTKYTPKGQESTLDVETGLLNEDEIKTFNSTLQNARYASQYVKQSRQLSDIAQSVNNDWTRIKLDEEKDKRSGEIVYTASIDNGNPIPLSGEEYKQLAVLTTGFPSVMGGFGVQFVKPTKAEAAPEMQQGMPGAQPPPVAEPPPTGAIAETESLRQQLGQLQAEESKKTAAQRQKRVDQINKEIEKLQRGSTAKYTGGGLPGVGAITTGQKTRRDIERDIAKIEQLVAERDRLEGKVQATAPTQTGFTIRKIN